MPPKYTGVARFKGFDGSADKVAQYEGRKLLARVMEEVMRGRHNVVLTEVLPDGTRLRGSFSGTLPVLEKVAPAIPAPVQVQFPPTVWVPSGFVTWPITDDAKFGWGMPVVQKTGSGITPYSLVNTNPGLDVTRWTAAGPLCEVLLTTVPQAGYPQRNQLTSALMFDPHQGPSPKVPTKPHPQGPWTGYRMEFQPFNDALHAPLAGARIAGFELLNTHRAGLGLDPLSMPLRGFYPIAQTYADMCLATSGFGHFNPVFWHGYKTPGDRVCKDGVPNVQGNAAPNNRNTYDFVNENLFVVATSFNPAGTDPNGEQYGTVTGPLPSSASTAFTGWLGSPPHKATIENVIWNGHSSFVDIGAQTFWSQDFQRKNQWLACGNAYWYSEHEEIPPLSWHSYPNQTLSYETFPWTATVDGILSTRKVVWPIKPSGYEIIWTDPYNLAQINSIVLSSLTGTTSGSVITNEGLWYHSWFNTNDTTKNAFEYVMPFLTSSIFMRGRCIGIAPNGAIVLGAGIQKITHNSKTAYRLQIIVHDHADQPSDYIANGMMAVVHIYHCDLDDVNGFLVHNENVIKGIRSTSHPAWPWLDSDDQWAWVDDGTVTVNTTGESGDPDLLSYTCLWRFNPAGTEACCLRERATAQDLRKSMFDYYQPPFTYPTGPDPGHPHVATITANGASFVFFIAGNRLKQGTRTLLLQWNANPPPFTDTANTPTLIVEPQPTVVTARYYATPQIHSPAADMDFTNVSQLADPDFDLNGGMFYSYTHNGYHVAVDYDKNGKRVYLFAMLASLNYTAPFFGDITGSDIIQPTCWFIAKGSFDAADIGDFEQVCVTGVADNNFDDWYKNNQSLTYNIYDVNTFSFSVVNYRVVEYVRQNSGAGVSPSFAATENCWTSTFFVDTWRNGERIHVEEVPNSGYWFDIHDECTAATFENSNNYWGIIKGTCGMIQGNYVAQRNGDWMLTYNVNPQPLTMKVVAPSNCTTISSYPRPICWPTNGQMYGVNGNPSPYVSFLPWGSNQPIGGWMTASFGDQSAIAKIMDIPGANPRCAYARVV